jgi:hypothetical protein
MNAVNFKKDEVWDSFLGTETVEQFQKNLLHSFQFKKEVPTKIVKSYEIVEKILLHSYTEYDFLDPALTKALASFEMALKTKYQQVTKRKWGGNLKSICQWFNKRGYFEYDCAALLDAIRNTRNKQSHPQSPFEGGIGVMGVFKHCNSLINDLYEDKEKRKSRRDEERCFREMLEPLRMNGAVASLLGTKQIIYDAGIIFINNKDPHKKYSGFLKKLFEIGEENGVKNLIEPFLFFFEADECVVENNSRLVFHNMKDSFLSIDLKTSLNDAEEFRSWKKRFNERKDYWQTDLVSTTKIDDHWYKAKNEFHF